MPRPVGLPKTGGRKKGSRNKAPAAKAAAIAASGLTPLDYMLQVMRDPLADPARRDDMAKASAPYCHAKLQPVDGQTGSSEIKARVRVEFVGTAP